MATTATFKGGTNDNLSVTLVPKDITTDEFEEMLATDRMFRDCFNRFLSQPIFGNTVQFNPVTFGFELQSNDRADVVASIRNAVYTARPKTPYQRYSTLHAFRPISLLPMEFNVPEPESLKSEFSVDVLESEHGNEWIKENRLPLFFNSDFYHYYRMGNLLAQAASIYRSGGKTSVIYDERVHAKRTTLVKKTNSIGNVHMQDTYVSYGESLSTETGARYTQSRMSQRTTTTTTSSGYGSPRISEVMSRPKSARPPRTSESNQSRADSQLGGALTTPLSETQDSGRESSGDELGNVPLNSLTNSDIGFTRPVIPLPSEVICVAERSPLGPLELAKKSEEAITRPVEDSPHPPSIDVSDEPAQGSGTTREELEGLKKIANPSISQALISAIRKAYPARKVLPEVMLSRLMLNRHFERIVITFQSAAAVKTADIRSVIERAEMLEQEEDEVASISAEIFDSEEVEANRKKGVHSISGLEVFFRFQDFMRKSSGWSVFSLWLDIDRLKRRLDIENLKLTPPIRQFLSSMRQRFLKPGGEFCLSNAMQVKLNLADPDEWTPQHLTTVQPALMQNLLSYWAIRFFVHENTRTQDFLQNNPSYQLYQSQLVGYDRPVHHSPKTPSILPSRPKSCMPRIKIPKPMPQPNRFNAEVTQAILEPRKPDMPFRRSYLFPMPDPNKNDDFDYGKSVSLDRRPKTAPTRRPASNESSRSEQEQIQSVVFGGEKMNKLLKVLDMESFSGQYLEQFIRKTKNQEWLNALLFWLELQQYHRLFTDVVTPDPEKVKSLANHLYYDYIMPGKPDQIGVSKKIAHRVLSRMDPPYEELFDEAEEHVIIVLHAALEAIETEAVAGFSEITKQTESRKIETSNAEILRLNTLGIFRNATALPKDEDDYSIESSPLVAEENRMAFWDNVPEQFRNWTLERIVFSRVELEAFRLYLEQNHVVADLLCWMDIEHFRRLPPGSDQNMLMKVDIKDKYLNRKYFFGAASPATKKEQTEMLEKNGGWAKVMAAAPAGSLLTEVQTFAKRRLDTKWVPLYLTTEDFAQRQQPSGDGEIEDEQTALKRRRAQQIAKMLEGHWSTTAQEALTFRNALSNVETKRMFYRFLKLRSTPGEYLANDLLFYDEVQKYKQLYHTHADELLINTKVQQIITCYLEDLHKQPSLQIDIPNDIAEKIAWHKKELGAYLFRDAQLTVFRILLAHWADFCRFRETVPTMPQAQRKTVRVNGKLIQMKAPMPTVGIDPKHFMEALERRKIIVDKKRQLKEREEEKDKMENEVESVAQADDGYNPFGAPATPPPHKGIWRYSDYQYGLERELLLNNTDRSTFMLNEDEFGKAVEFFPNLFDSSTN